MSLQTLERPVTTENTVSTGTATAAKPLMPNDHLESVSAWGMNQKVVSYVYRPNTPEGVSDTLTTARQHGLSVGMRGAGRSYGDASLNAENICLDMTRMNRILDWNPETGIIKVETGVTIEQLWRYILGDGWWPYVCSGTMYPTIGGAAGMNIHGKNNFKVGTIGDHILDFDILIPSTGEVLHCSRTENPELFHAAIGGFGMLGVFLNFTLETKKVYSGQLDVLPIPVRNWSESFSEFAAHVNESDYLVGWVDCFASGDAAGRGLLHRANYLKPGDDPNPAQTLRVENQDLPDTIMGIFPKSILWRFMTPFTNNLGMQLINQAKYITSLRPHKHRQAHAEFQFLLDYVPNWKKAYLPGGLIQYQSFIPKENAEAAFREQIALCQRRGIIPYLGVFKQHRPDPFLMTHAVDGFSFALDFKITRGNREKLWSLCGEMDKIVQEAGGRFYFAKDATLHPSRIEPYFREGRVQKFLQLKNQYDPEGILQTDLFRRVFAPVL